MGGSALGLMSDLDDGSLPISWIIVIVPGGYLGMNSFVIVIMLSWQLCSWRLVSYYDGNTY